MWISRERYEELVKQAADGQLFKDAVKMLQAQVEHERKRAEQAVDVLLVMKQAAPITPVTQPKPEVGMFDEDPDELQSLLQSIKADPVGTLVREGTGDNGVKDA